MTWITTLFLIDAVIAVGCFVWQWYVIALSRVRAIDHSIASWAYWTVSTTIGTLFAIYEAKHPVLIGVVVMLTICNFVTTILIAYKRFYGR